MLQVHHQHDNTFVPNPFKPPSGWTPHRGLNADLDTFLNITSFFITDTPPKPNVFPNLQPEESQAIISLRENKDIIIKPADKGGAIVILNRADYITEAERQLCNTEHYRPLDTDLTQNIVKDINKFLQRVKPYLAKDLVSFNTIKDARTPLFYLLPKIHKPGNPGRPIVSAVGGPTEKLSATVDFYLKPLASEVKSYLKDTTDFLNKILDLRQIPAHSFLVTADVSSLYTSIPHRDGILAAKRALDTRGDNSPPTWILLRFLHFVLTCNCFRFNNQHYLQIQGTSMGTKCAPNYAVLFMDQLETNFLTSQPLKPLVWWRFIDDIFFIWTFRREDLCAFMESLSRFHPKIKFTYEVSSTSMNFLDTTVIKEEDGTLQTTLYTKPTDAHLYLHYHSCHPRQQIRNIPFGQLLRVRRICSTLDEFEKHSRVMCDHFRLRGYPRNLLESATVKARNTDRLTLLRKADTNAKTIVPFITKYDPHRQHIGSILKNHRGILNRIGPQMDHSVITVAYKRANNIRNLLVRADIDPPNRTKGSQPCRRPCNLCPFMENCSSVTSKSNKQTFTIRHSINCNSTSVVYMIQCQKCGTQYIGQTGNSIRERFHGHFADIRNKNMHKPVSRHFTSTEHDTENVKIIGLQITPGDVNTRLRTEEAFITYLNTAEPQGLNIRHG
ncbi:uncharacterized protein LOC132547247 [Ylistrum balloti]|uniref:uncharacterized protein LOC132547247 n=1 Tax=Ylistrum balloti TaxID=509963 RepID=UPI002905F65E|nr:uncharacterized protein LOC132547247 [Ylistrum balloti]